MSSRRMSLCFFILLGLIGSAYPAPGLVDLSGTWVGNWDTEEDTGPDILTVKLVASGTSYTGSIADSLGFIPAETKISDVQVNSEGIVFSFVMVFVPGRRDEIQIRAVRDGNYLKGEMIFVAKGAAVPFEMKRK